MTILKARFHFLVAMVLLSCQCQQSASEQKESPMTAETILGNPEYPAISYGGYRATSRDIQPSVDEIKSDLRILQAAGFKIIRTYNVHFPHASNILKAIKALQEENPNFEMYVMLGAWINCEGAWTDAPNHEAEDLTANKKEIETAIALVKQYPEIIKILAVGNEAMVHWATSYFVQPGIILKWVNHLQNLKKEKQLPETLWITSSDNFASWGGGDASYHKKDLEDLIRAVDYVSVHSYPFHDTHYNPEFWKSATENAFETNKLDQIETAMESASTYAIAQYNQVVAYTKSLGIEKPVHIGETGWASISNGFYGDSGSRAADEYKQALYFQKMQKWSRQNGISCFFFEAFDEPWKDAGNPSGSENHFGLFTVNGQAKYALWDKVSKGEFKDMQREGNTIAQTFLGNYEILIKTVLVPNFHLKN